MTMNISNSIKGGSDIGRISNASFSIGKSIYNIVKDIVSTSVSLAS